ncbi:hypothetical protein M9434_003424 [Picochlorum sp. BPE23]|nr:hypothetical protein M9434_003424 [Picochlorum sp. BPE23]
MNTDSDFKEQFRNAKAARENSKQQTTSSQYARGDSMPPPPPRRTRHTSTMHSDSQMTQLQPIGGSGETQSVNGGTGSDLSQLRRGVELTSEAAKSLQDSCVPAGFFEETRTASKRQKRSDVEYSAFMQEMSALGAVKENKDNTVVEVSVARNDARARSGGESARPEHAGEQSVGGHVSDGEADQQHEEKEVESDTEEEFHQFVRRERMQELKRAVQRRDKAALQDQQSVAAHISDITSEEGSNIRFPLQNSLATQSQKSAAESYVYSAEESPSSSDELEDDDFDWKSKKLT